MENLKHYTDFCDDGEKMFDFFALSKEDFLSIYSYLTEEEYELTKAKAVPKLYRVILKSWGGTRSVMEEELSAKEALDLCEFFDWGLTDVNEYVWDMEIEEM